MNAGTLLLAYTEVHGEAQTAAATLGGAFGWEVRKVELDPSDTTAYHAALAATWTECAAAGRSFFNVEHDVVLNRAVFDALGETTRQIVGFPYWEGASHNVSLGCTAFAGEFVTKHTDLLEVVGAMAPELEGPARHWEWLACRTFVQLLRRRVGLPGNLDVLVGHLHQYETPDPGAACDEERCSTHGIRRFKLDRMECA